MRKMNDLKVSVIPCSATPLIFDETKCVGCNTCVNICQCDIMIPNPEKGKHPIVAYPGECYYCGACVMMCPNKGAIKLQHPVMNRTKFILSKPDPTAK
jgi:NAD-dependent dihydropyrimidine dehydrogenase PreA subunit